MTNMVTSADGTRIAYDLLGSGPPVVVVGGATCERTRMAGIAEELAEHFSVVNYDRRGRGESGDAEHYEVAREVEDLGALAAAVGGPVALYGHSSGAGLVLQASAAGVPVSRAVLHEPPYVAADMAAESRASAAELTALLGQGRRDDALAHFLTMTGVPAEEVAGWRTEPWWAGTAALAHTLAYDTAVLGGPTGGTVPTALVAAATVPTLVLVGGASPEWMLETVRDLSRALPDGRLQVLPGQHHVVPPEVLAPVLREFLAP
ncbi:alpha/beta fold hydrolase [Actinophytocola xanthii]|uniref:Alpha/beta hydrolase n=1 Tax=Actinophytocola xanthii TaxID=1912961 RepID=A0A1Q8CUH8_9PSEU|nr:alpha/beta hydrolase [Actinophytocola xanthii]OLF18018.1 alpha/beta hydrolase [Actinophytocola xanthii]